MNLTRNGGIPAADTIGGRSATVPASRVASTQRRAAWSALAMFLAAAAAADDWPQWRGPDRSNVSRETDLLEAWPPEGPPLLWTVTGLGEGIAAMAVANAAAYTLRYRDNTESLFALAGSDPHGGADGATPALATPSPPAPGPDSIEVRGVGFRSPECVVWDPAADVYLLSNLHGQALEKDDNGFISRVRPDGTVEALKWIEGAAKGVTLHAPKGMAILSNTLWVADIDVLRRFDRVTGKTLGEIAVTGATYLDKVLAYPPSPLGGEGLLVTDTALWREDKANTTSFGKLDFHVVELHNGTVTARGAAGWVRPGHTFRIVPARVTSSYAGIGQASPDHGSGQPFGLVTSAALTTWGVGLVSWDRAWFYQVVSGYDRDEILAVPLPQAQCYDVMDLACGGRAFTGDGSVWGCWLVSSWAGRCVYLVRLDDPPGATVSEWVRDLRAPGKLGYDLKRSRVLIPLCLDDALVIRPGPKRTVTDLPSSAVPR